MLKHGIALVISNYEYDDININNLPSCKKDGQDMDNVLQNLGFDTLVANNPNREVLLEQIVEFIKLLPLYQTALCYYSGHGLQIDGKNYIVPKDAKLVNNKSILINMSLVEVDLIVDGFKENSKNTNLLILDACRTNPFLSKGFTSKGLAEINAGAGTLISYATSPNDVSIGYNSEAINSLFTKHFINNIVKPNLKIEEVFKLTRIDVETETDGNQIPWESTSLKQDFFFIKEDDEIINSHIYEVITNFQDNGEVLITLSEKYSFTITDIYLRYYHYKMNLPGGIYLGDTEIYGLALKNVLEKGFYYKNYRWYYEGKPVKMGEFLHRVPTTDNQPLIVVINYRIKIEESKKLIIVAEINMPDGMKFGCSFTKPNELLKNTLFSEVRSKQLSFEFIIDYKTIVGRQIEFEVFSISNALQPENIKSIIGDNGQNMAGECVCFDSINGYQIKSKLNTYLLEIE